MRIYAVLMIMAYFGLHASSNYSPRVPSPSNDSHNVWKLYKLDDKKYMFAQCLDGSMGGFWFHEGSGSGLANFVVFHQVSNVLARVFS